MAHTLYPVQVIAGLPEQDAPALFSLPANIDRSAQQANGERVVAALKVGGRCAAFFVSTGRCRRDRRRGSMWRGCCTRWCNVVHLMRGLG